MNSLSFHGISKDTYKNTFCIADTEKDRIFIYKIVYFFSILNFNVDPKFLPVRKKRCVFFFTKMFSLRKRCRNQIKRRNNDVALFDRQVQTNSFEKLLAPDHLFCDRQRPNFGLICRMGYPTFTFRHTFNFYYNSDLTILYRSFLV